MIVLAGASASGKTEVAKFLAEHYGIVKVITTTTRAKRIHEVDGVDYFFVSKEKFQQLIKEDKFVEYTIYNENYYGSTKDQIAPDKCIVIDPSGLKAYHDLHNPEIVIFFLNSEEETRYQRMLARGDEKEKAKSRIIHDRKVFTKDTIQGVDYYIDSETNTVPEVAKIVLDTYQKHLAKLRK